MGYINGYDRNQLTFLPESIEDYVAEDNEIRFIEAFVETLDMKLLNFKYSTCASTGRSPYNPADMLKLYCYGYINAIRSSRKLEKECFRNLEVIWLIHGLRPDYRTIADFRKNNKGSIKLVFRELATVCKKLELYGNETVAIDGSKFKAVNSKQRNFTKDILKKRLRDIDQKIDDYMRDLEENDEKEESTDTRCSGEELRKKIEALKERKERYMGLKASMEERDQEQVSLTDPDSRRMLSNQRYDVCYNVQTTAEEKNKLILDYEVTNQAGDKEQLEPMAGRAKEILGVDKLEVLADKGYYSAEGIKGCVDSQITPYVPRVYNFSSRTERTYCISQFKYDKGKDVYICPNKQELQFKRSQTYRNKKMKVYSTKECLGCEVKDSCTKRLRGRQILRWEHEEMLEDIQKKLESDSSKYKKRKCIIEHIFGTIKRNLHGGYLLMKEKSGATADVGLMMIAYNMKRMINIKGVKALIYEIQ